ncbi:hypothetical protein HNQ04_001649 [Deinococcus radiopugnans ATCC 19172]|uniref:Uncharacterized protein n=1 Tax=Deinococcus radiopugnans ATCC 19172 TaxID=585398 RepID=A0ABR6NU49_9DEIO|nr:hypothetical protein [Deinococcus radiopugnans ATCC 19172]
MSEQTIPHTQRPSGLRRVGAGLPVLPPPSGV